ncbi:MAG: NfeD family protein [Lachnospiraceae bacterium]|nr:NfeD family protein [Lachnospiraceae bacterium]
MEVVGWLVALVALVIIEISTMGLTTIWFAAGALVAILAAALGAPLFVQIALFLIVSVLMLVFTRPLAVKFFNNDREKTNVDSVIGKKGIVTGQINNLQGTGQVTLNGLEWTARSAQEDKVISEGSVVVIRDVQGVKLIVELDEERV